MPEVVTLMDPLASSLVGSLTSSRITIGVALSSTV